MYICLHNRWSICYCTSMTPSTSLSHGMSSSEWNEKYIPSWHMIRSNSSRSWVKVGLWSGSSCQHLRIMSYLNQYLNLFRGSQPGVIWNIELNSLKFNSKFTIVPRKITVVEFFLHNLADMQLETFQKIITQLKVYSWDIGKVFQKRFSIVQLWIICWFSCLQRNSFTKLLYHKHSYQ